MALSSIARRIRNYLNYTYKQNEDVVRRVLADGRAAARATGVRSPRLRTRRVHCGKREFAVSARPSARDGRAQRPWTRSCQISLETRDRKQNPTTQVRRRRLRSLRNRKSPGGLKIPHDEVFVDDLFKALDKNKDGTVELRSGSNLPYVLDSSRREVRAWECSGRISCYQIYGADRLHRVYVYGRSPDARDPLLTTDRASLHGVSRSAM